MVVGIETMVFGHHENCESCCFVILSNSSREQPSAGLVGRASDGSHPSVRGLV